MNKKDIANFIEEMETIGDIWKPEDVKRVYGKQTLDDALMSRKAEIGVFFDIIGKVINRDNS